MVLQIAWMKKFRKAATADVLQKKLFLKISKYSQEKSLGLQIYLKKTPTRLFSCEHCKSFKNSYFDERLLQNLNVKLRIKFSKARQDYIPVF